jgi:phosphoglycolate phosphatase-like HAD superfamily hydrolase
MSHPQLSSSTPAFLFDLDGTLVDSVYQLRRLYILVSVDAPPVADHAGWQKTRLIGQQ